MAGAIEFGIKLKVDNREIAGKLIASVNDIRKVAQESGEIGRRSAESSRAVERLSSVLRNMATVAAGVFSFREMTSTLAEFDRLNASLKTVTGSMESARVAMDFIRRFATETPFELQEVTEAFIRLKSLGLDASEEALRSFGNTASAMGKPLMQFVEAVADATTGEFERLKEFGIRASQEGEKVVFTFRGVSTTVRKEAGEIAAYLRRIGETEFAGGMRDQMNTIGGALSNLRDAFSNFVDFLGNLGIRDALMRSFSGVIEFIQGIQKQLNAVFGSGMQAQIDAYEVRLTELRGKLDNLRSIMKTPVVGGLLASPEEIRRTEQSIADMESQLEHMRAVQRAQQSEQDRLLSSIASPGGGPSSTAIDTKPKKAKTSIADDARQEIQARIAAVRDGIERERQLLEWARNLDVLKAGENAEEKLRIEQKYQLDLLDLRRRELEQAIDLKRQEAATIADRGQKARATQELKSLEQQYRDIVVERQYIEQTGEIKLLDLQRQKKDELRQIYLKYDEMAAAIERVREDAKRAFELGATDRQMEMIVAAGNRQIEGLAQRTETVSEAWSQLGLAFQSAFSNAIVSGKSFGDVLKGLAVDLLQMSIQFALIKPLVESLFGTGKGGDKGWIGTGLGALAGLLGFEKGGVMTSRGPLPLRRYAGGGIASSPQLALFGEGSRPEAFVPLPDGRSIPVSFRFSGAGVRSGGGTHVEVIDQRGSGAPIEVQRSRDAAGNDRIRMLVRDEIKVAIASGAFDSVMSSNYSLRRPGAVR